MSITPTEITDRARKVVAEHFGRSPAEITDATDFHADLHGDSLDSVEVVFALELEFDIEIPDDASEAMKTFGALVKWLVGAAGGRAEAA